MALDAHVGCLLDPDLESLGERVRVVVNEVLLRNGLPAHREPSSWEDIWARHPGKRRKRRELGLRLGFYSSDRFHRFERLARHLAVRRRAPPGPDRLEAVSEADYQTAVQHGRGFDHALAASRMGTVAVPLEFADVLGVEGAAPGGACLRLVSAPNVRSQCRVIAFVLDPPTAARASKAKKLQETAARIEDMGFELNSAAPRTPWAEELEACSRLARLADDVLWSGAFAVVG